jgi:predicted phosphodiesterase
VLPLATVMRIAIVSDIHGNRTAFEAVLADLRNTAPDLIFHGGDLAHGGASPAEIVDQIRDLGWPGVLGNTDQMLFSPESLSEFASESPNLHSLFAAIEEIAVAERGALGEERLQWLRSLPRVQNSGAMALVHASPESLWRAPAPTASDAELESVYAPLGQPIAVYAHIHKPYIRKMPVTNAAIAFSTMTVTNTGSVSLSYDGDPRASYLLLDNDDDDDNDAEPEIRRVEYDISAELKALAASTIPHADWIARMLKSATPQMP